jgi:hypothetical protein
MDGNEHQRLEEEPIEAMSRLPRVRWPSPALEERTVIALRNEGLLRGSLPASRKSVWRVPLAAAAAAVLFAGGVLVGQRLEASEVGQLADGYTEAEVTPDLADVRRATEFFVTTMTRAGALATADDPVIRAEVRAIAVDGLRAAAGAVWRIAPDEPVAGEIFRGFDRAVPPARSTDESTPVRHVVWF